jgi:hypothetical protein
MAYLAGMIKDLSIERMQIAGPAAATIRLSIRQPATRGQ